MNRSNSKALAKQWGPIPRDKHYSDSPRVWLQLRLDELSSQFYDLLDGLEGIIYYDYPQADKLYAEYHLSGYSVRQIEDFQCELGYYLNQLIDRHRTIDLPPRKLFIKDHQITLRPPTIRA